MTLLEFLLIFEKDQEYYLELYENGDISLCCSIEDAIKTFEYDKRGKLILKENSVKVHEYSSSVTGIYGRINIQVFL